MPVYDYLCARCGPFTDMRPMVEADRPRGCPGCGDEAPRAFLTAPYVAAMPAERRLAHAANERSASAPAVLSRHGGGCSCCAGTSMRYKKTSRGAGRPDGAKSFPAKRPWMISH